MVTGQITCHCGQTMAGYMADSHVTPNGVSCVGIRHELHTPSICLECKLGTHSPSFVELLDTIRCEH
jgi:hypothetical protein